MGMIGWVVAGAFALLLVGRAVYFQLILPAKTAKDNYDEKMKKAATQIHDDFRRCFGGAKEVGYGCWVINPGNWQSKQYEYQSGPGKNEVIITLGEAYEHLPVVRVMVLSPNNVEVSLNRNFRQGSRWQNLEPQWETTTVRYFSPGFHFEGSMQLEKLYEIGEFLGFQRPVEEKDSTPWYVVNGQRI